MVMKKEILMPNQEIKQHVKGKGNRSPPRPQDMEDGGAGDHPKLQNFCWLSKCSC